MFPALHHRVLGGLRAHLRAISYSSRSHQGSGDEENKGANGKANLNGSRRSVGDPEDRKTISLPNVSYIVTKAEPKAPHQPPLESMEIYDTVSDLAQGTVTYWRRIHQHTPSEASMVLERTLGRLKQLVEEKKSRLDHVTVATIIHQLASISSVSKLSHQVVSHGLVGDLLTLADEFRLEFDINHIANILWAMGKIGRPVLQLNLGNGERTANDLLRSLVLESNELIGSLTPLTICQILYGLSMLSSNFKEQNAFVRLLAAVAKQQLTGFSTQGISVLSISLARLNYIDTLYLVPALCKRVEEQITHFKKPQQLCNIAWALARMRHSNDSSLLRTIAKRTMGSLEAFQFSEVTMLLWAFYKLKFFPGNGFLAAVEDYLIQRCHLGKPQEISNALLALADFGGHSSETSVSKELIGRLVSALKNPAPGMPARETQHLTNAAWSLAVLGALDMNTMKWILDEIVASGHQLNFIQQRQLYQSAISLVFGHQKVDIRSQVPHEQMKILDFCRGEWLGKQKKGAIIPSMVEVFNVLRRIGYKCESRLVNGVISASTAAIAHGSEIAVEIDTPIRCFRNDRNKRLGRYDLRQKILEACGFKVLRFSLDEWVALKGMGPRLEYLKARLSSTEMETSQMKMR